jgi:lipopolysaccharide export system protein LptA
MPAVRNLHLPIFTCFLVLALYGARANALNTDSDQPIQISADAGMVNEAAGISTYSGNVAIDQGSMHILADEVEVIMANNQVVQIIARSLPESRRLARYEHLPDDKEEPVSAEAKMITYLVQEERLHLSGDARLQQTGDSFSGELLYYDVNRGIVDLKSGTGAGDRIKMTISPKQK